MFRVLECGCPRSGSPTRSVVFNMAVVMEPIKPNQVINRQPVPNDKTLDVRRSVSRLQATRHEPARQTVQWVVYTPVGPVACKTVAEARQCAAGFGCSIHLQKR